MSDARERARAAREALRQEREAAAALAGKSATGDLTAPHSPRQALLAFGLNLDDVASEEIDTDLSYHRFAPARLNQHICQCGLLPTARIHNEPPHEYAPGQYVWGVCGRCHHAQTADCHDVRPEA